MSNGSSSKGPSSPTIIDSHMDTYEIQDATPDNFLGSWQLTKWAQTIRFQAFSIPSLKPADVDAGLLTCISFGVLQMYSRFLKLISVRQGHAAHPTVNECMPLRCSALWCKKDGRIRTSYVVDFELGDAAFAFAFAFAFFGVGSSPDSGRFLSFLSCSR